jgi:hypothetical protein
VVLYTDNILFFKSKLPQSVTYISLDKELIQNKGSINFSSIMKIELLKRFANRFSGNVLYLDSDTPTSKTNKLVYTFRLSCCRLFNRKALSIEETRYLKDFHHYFTKKNHQLILEMYTVLTKTFSYNAIIPTKCA